MEYKIRHCLCFLLILALGACSPKRKVVIDPVTISALKPGAHVYRGAYTRFSDILHTRLDLRLNFDSSEVYGKAYIKAKPWFKPSDSLVLDAKGMAIEQVALSDNGDLKPLRFDYKNNKLRITLDRQYSNKDTYTVYVQYVARPSKLVVGKDIGSPGDRGFYFVNTEDSTGTAGQQFWTQGETECNSSWFPTINDTQEKMTQEISITVPSRMVTLSNGVLDFSSENGDGTRTDTWLQDKPHSTYLTMVAGGDFQIVKDEWQGKEVSYYMEPKFAGNARMIFGKTPEMIGFFSKLTGVKYPWDKYSQIVVRNFYGGAMENTSASVFYEGMNMSAEQYQDNSNEDIISHELFHHWFGDLATARSWSNLPLNESFATYGEYLWREHKYGREVADELGWSDQQKYLHTETARDLDLIRYNYADREQMFDVVSYQKGGRVLHMLRYVLGDDLFFKGMNIYLKNGSYKATELSDLRKAFEEVSGQDLNWFFNEWFLACGHPVFKINSTYDASSSMVTLKVDQTQDLGKYPLYRMPVKVDIYVGDSVQHRSIIVSKASQEFRFAVKSAPALVNFDADKYLLAEKEENKTVAEYAFQYDHAPLFVDRMEALKALATAPAIEISSTFAAALGDKNWALRKEALGMVGRFSGEGRESFYDRIKVMALKDENPHVRAAAVRQIRVFYSKKDNKSFFEQVAADKSPSVKYALTDR